MLEQFLQTVFSRLQAYFEPKKMGLFAGELLIESVLALFVLAFFYLLWRIVNRFAAVQLRRSLDKTSAIFIETVIKFTMFCIAVIVALNIVGVQTTALLGSLGVASLTIGFALRDTLSNIISGILIFLDRPFTIDDMVEIEGKYGRVDRITLRTTRIVTNDGKMLAVPNSEIMNKTVVSYTNFPHLRIDIAVTVAVTEDLDRIRNILISIVQNNSDYMPEPPPCVVVTELNDYNVMLELRAWLLDERRHVEERLKLREKVFKVLTEAGVQMPFETIQLASHTVTVDLPSSSLG